MADSFVHLHVHTEYSMLDGAARVADVVKAAAADRQPALGITDHGNMYGALDFYRAAQAQGLTPIVGTEAYFTSGSRFDRPARGGTRYHITLLAENETGYRNLLKLVSLAYLDGYFYKPRLDLDLLDRFHEGIIATSGCLGGWVSQLLGPDGHNEEGGVHQRDFDAAVRAAATFQEVFGRDNFFIEVQDHGLAPQRKVMADLLDVAKRIDAPLLATNDSHYTHRHEAEAHSVLLCIQTGTTLDDPNRFRFDADEFYLKTAAEMRALFPTDSFPGACDNTLLVAERANLALEFGRIRLPAFAVPAGETEASYLRRLVLEGALDRYGAGPDGAAPANVAERIDYELSVVEQMGFPGYFLIVWDLIAYAKKRGIRTGPGRGSAAGSILSYCLGITKIDPITYELPFERFLNPGRREMPDIDMDFDERYRGEMIRYATERYGADRVAQIITFQTIGGKQAMRDAARVLGEPYAVGDRLAKAYPPHILGKEARFRDIFETPNLDECGTQAEFENWVSYHREAAELRRMCAEDATARRVVDASRGLEGLRRQDSIHAAAVVISAEPLIDVCPVQRKGDGAELVTQYEMHAIEALGLLKMDFLGLRNLTTIERALELIGSNRGERIDIDAVPLDDAATYELLQRGDAIGVFQLEGDAMRSLMRSLRPDRFEDLIALISLYRPGPMGAGKHTAYADRKNGRAPVDYLHPDLEVPLGKTYGIMVYQEQVMAVAAHMAGYSMAEADRLRKGMGKKIAAVIEAQREEFVAGCVGKGYAEDLARTLWAEIEHFSGYGFSRNHAAPYALVAYQTAWLKTHYPAEYMAALLTSMKREKKEALARYLAECRSTGIKVLPPCVNSSELDFVARGDSIPFGLSAIRNVGEGVVEHILTARAEREFKDFGDFVARVDLAVLNKRTIESLIKAGAFDAMGHTRRGLMEVFEACVDGVVDRRRNEQAGQFSLFADTDSAPGGGYLDLPPVPEHEWTKEQRLAFEREMLGLYVSDHPLAGLERDIARVASHTLLSLAGAEDNLVVTVAGLATEVQRRLTRAGEFMFTFLLEDMEGTVEVMVFPRVARECATLLVDDARLVVTARVDQRGDDVKLVASEIRPLVVDDAAAAAVAVRLRAAMLTGDTVERLRGILSGHPGDAGVVLHLESAERTTVMAVPGLGVTPSTGLYAELKVLLGPDAFTV